VVALRRRLEALLVRWRGEGVDLSSLPGGGAAGGLAGGLAVLGARLVPGFEVVADAVDLAARLAAADLVVTGEGRLDASSWAGKVVGGVRALAGHSGVPLLIVAGAVGPGATVPGLDVVDLSARYGEDRALADPVGCVRLAVHQALAGRGVTRGDMRGDTPGDTPAP
jgi:glycerate kinase